MGLEELRDEIQSFGGLQNWALYQSVTTQPEMPDYAAIAQATQRDLYQETSDTLRAQLDLAPRIYQAEAHFRPLYAMLDVNIMKDVLSGQGGLLDYYRDTLVPATSQLSAMAASAQRSSDIADLELLGAQAVEAVRAANPEQTALLKELTSQAMSELAAGRGLTPEEERGVIQSSRAAWDARGLLHTEPSTFAEVMASYDAGRQRQSERRNFASQVLGLSQALTVDPYMAVLGRPALNYDQNMANQANAYAAAAKSDANFDPFNQYASSLYSGNQSTAANVYGMDLNAAMGVYGTQTGILGNVWNTMYNAQSAQNIANTNMQGAIIGGGLSALGSAGGAIGAAAIMCWVAREVYGKENYRWRLFKDWLLTRAPRWFRELYRTRGEAFAAWLHDRACMKRVIRWWMDARINNMMNQRMEACHAV